MGHTPILGPTIYSFTRTHDPRVAPPTYQLRLRVHGAPLYSLPKSKPSLPTTPLMTHGEPGASNPSHAALTNG